MKITILLIIAIFTIFTPIFLVIQDVGLDLEGVIFFVGVTAYYLVCTSVIYAVATFIKNDRVRKWFFVVGFVITFLPLALSVLVYVYFWYNPIVCNPTTNKSDMIERAIIFLLLFVPGLLLNPPVIFAYVAHTLYTRRKRKQAVSTAETDATTTET